MPANQNIVRFFGLLAIFLFISCATYYQKRISFQQDFSQGDIKSAQKFLLHHKKAAEKKDRLLYFYDRGVVEQMLGNYDSSNHYFEKAYIYSQDFKRDIGTDLASMVSNPMVRPYKGEDYEVVMVHFYKAINYLQLSEPDAALIEVRRINIKLNEQSDKYEGKRYRYKEDAFAHLLMGCIYESKRDFNNAFIAYRNAYKTYGDVYPEFGVSAPDQLKKDILRTAYLTGFYDEVDHYEKEFDMKAEIPADSTGSLVFFWMNGLSPVKGEVSLNFAKSGGDDGGFIFADDQAGISFPVYYSNDADSDKLNELSFVRMAVPKFNRRDPLIQSAVLIHDDQEYPLQMAENISEIAIANLEDRLLKELASSIGRLALKQATEAAAREQNDNLGVAVSFVNALTEKADTRNWQTLPHNIQYQRLYLKAGEKEIKLATQSTQIPNDTTSFKIEIRENRTSFKSFHSLASTALAP